MLFAGVRVFMDEDGNDEKPEVAAARYKLATALEASTIHHPPKLKTLTRGDNHRHILLVSIHIRGNARDPFKVLLTLTTIRVGGNHKKIEDIINALHHAKLKADLVLPGTIEEKVLRGAILHICSAHPRYRNLAETMSRLDYNGDYEQMCNELRLLDDNSAEQQEQEQANSTQAEDKERALMAMFTKAIQASSSKKRNEEIRRNYLYGRCTFGEKCR
jgi:hypothetical protein